MVSGHADIQQRCRKCYIFFAQRDSLRMWRVCVTFSFRIAELPTLVGSERKKTKTNTETVNVTTTQTSKNKF